MVRTGLLFRASCAGLMASPGTGRQRTCLSIAIRLTMGCSRAIIGLSLRMSSFLERCELWVCMKGRCASINNSLDTTAENNNEMMRQY